MNTIMTPITYFTRLWHFLTRPHSSIKDIEQRRQSILLGGLILALVTLSLVASVLLIVRNGGLYDTVIGLWLVMLFTLGIYFLNRYGYYQVGAYLFVASNFLTMYLMPILTNDPAWLWFPMMSLILSAALLPGWATVGIFFLSMAAHLLHGVFLPMTNTFSNFTTTIVYLVVAPLVLVFMNHRINVERERQQELQTANEALQRSEAELEKRVVQRTRDLNLASDVARQVTTQLNLEQLLPQLVEQTRATFDLYYVAVFLYQEGAKRLVLQAGTNITGKQLLGQEVSFSLEARPSLIAKAGREKRHIVINNVSHEEAFAANKHLPNTQSEIVLPMLVGDNLIGVLGLQSEVKNRFTPADVEIFSTLAEQIAIAVNNAQLYAKQRQLAEELRQADIVKNQFLASMSHELRTPLNGIMNFTEMISSGMMGDVNEDQKDLLDQSLDSSKHLLGLINDVLDITKIQAGKLNLFIEDNVSIYDELDNVISLIKPMLREHYVSLVEDIDDHLPLIRGDKRRIRQILLNLASNAVKFTLEGTITISAKHQVDHILLAVSDTGAGISEEMQNIIFEPFIQTVDGIKHTQGTGLGLPISKSLVEAHGGRIWLESTKGEGAAFYATFPISEATPERVK